MDIDSLLSNYINKNKPTGKYKPVGEEKMSIINGISNGYHHFSILSKNKEIEDNIRDFSNECLKLVNESFDDLIDNNLHKKCKKENKDFLSVLSDFGDKLLFEKNTSNIKRYFLRFFEEDDVEDIMEDIKMFRLNAFNYSKPSIVSICKYFNINPSLYTRYKHKWNL